MTRPFARWLMLGLAAFPAAAQLENIPHRYARFDKIKLFLYNPSRTLEFSTPNASATWDYTSTDGPTFSGAKIAVQASAPDPNTRWTFTGVGLEVPVTVTLTGSVTVNLGFNPSVGLPGGGTFRVRARATIGGTVWAQAAPACRSEDVKTGVKRDSSVSVVVSVSCTFSKLAEYSIPFAFFVNINGEFGPWGLDGGPGYGDTRTQGEVNYGVGLPAMAVDPDRVDLVDEAPASFRLTNGPAQGGTEGPLDWSAEKTYLDGAGWMTVNPSSGRLRRGESQTITVSADPSGMQAGRTYIGVLLIRAPDSLMSPRKVYVYLKVTQAVTPKPDDISIVSCKPSEGEVTGADFAAAGGATATVSYLLGSAATGSIVLGVFERNDEGAQPLASSQPVSVTRSSDPKTVTLTIPGYTPPNDWDVLFLRAYFTAGATKMSAPIRWSLRTVPDVVRIRSVIRPRNNKDPDLYPGALLRAEMIVDATLGSAGTATLVLRAYDQDGKRINEPETGPRCSLLQGKPATCAVSLTLYVPDYIAGLVLKPVLLGSSGNVLNPDSSEFVVYTVAPFPPSLKLQLGDKDSYLVADRCRVAPGRNFTYTVDYETGREIFKAVELVCKDPKGAEFFRGRLGTTSTDTVGTLQGTISICGGPSADYADCFAELKRNSGAIVRSDPVQLSSQFVDITATIPDSFFQFGRDKAVDFEVNYRADAGPGSAVDLVCLTHESSVRVKMADAATLGASGRGRRFSCDVSDLARDYQFVWLGVLALVPPDATRPPCWFNNSDCRPAYAYSSAFFKNSKLPDYYDPTQNPILIRKLRLQATLNRDNAAIQAQSRDVGIQNQLDGATLVPLPGARPSPREAASPAFPGFIGINASWSFGPSIPDNGTFEADLTLQYDLTDLPDDPNFSESAMQVVSFDPSTGRMRVYATRLDTGARTATAHIAGLAPLYTLGVFGPFKQRTLNLPLVRSAGAQTTAFAFTNLGTSGASVTLTPYDRFGQAGTPVQQEIGAGQQWLLAASDLATDPGSISGGWVQARAGANSVVAMEIESDGESATALAALDYNAPVQVLPWVEYGTWLYVSNTSAFTDNPVLELRAADGTVVGTATVNLSAKGTWSGSLPFLFPGVQQDFTGWLVLRGNQELGLVATLVNDGGEVGSQARPAALAAKKLYTAHVDVDPLRSTRLNLVNPSASAARVTVAWRSDAGTAQGTPASVTIPAGGQVRIDAAAAGASGTAIVDSDVPLLGETQFFDPWGRLRAALPLEGTAARTAALGLLSNASNVLTLVSVFNTGSPAANVRLRAIAPDASEIASATFKVAANGRLTGSLPQLLPASSGAVAGYVIVEADQPVVVAGLLASDDFSVLTGLVPQRGFVSSGPPPAPVPSLSLQPAGLNFGSLIVSQSADLRLTIANSGPGTLTVTAISADHPAFRVTSASLPLSVAAGASAVLTVRFTPTGAGAVSGVLTVSSNGAPSPASVKLTGTGVAASPAPNPGAVVLSDSFNRADATSCALGRADLALGGSGTHYYIPIHSVSGVGIVSGALQNNTLDYSGVQLAAAGACSARGETVLQDLYMRVDLLVPASSTGVGMAGPYFRSRAAAPGDGIIGGTSAGYWVALTSTGEVRLRGLNPNAVIATTGVPSSFDAAVFHKLELVAQGSALQVWLDGARLTFTQSGSRVSTVSLPASSGSNHGTAGIAFAAEDNRGNAGGQRVKNLVIASPGP